MYSGDPSLTPLDAIRFLINDTTSPEEFSDKEIQFLYERQGKNIWNTASLLCNKISVSITGGGLSSKSIGGLSESYSQGSVQFFLDLAKEYKKQGMASAVPWAFGLGSCENMERIFWLKQFDYYHNGWWWKPERSCF